MWHLHGCWITIKTNSKIGRGLTWPINIFVAYFETVISCINAPKTRAKCKQWKNGQVVETSQTFHITNNHEDHPINKLQHGVILLIYKTQKLRDIHFVGNVLQSTSCDFYYDDVTSLTWPHINQGHKGPTVEGITTCKQNIRRDVDTQHLWRQSVHSCRLRTMEQSSIAPERRWLIVQWIPAVAR